MKFVSFKYYVPVHDPLSYSVPPKYAQFSPTVEPLITDPLKIGQPLDSGQPRGVDNFLGLGG